MVSPLNLSTQHLLKSDSMKVATTKENILKKVRNALSQPVQLPFPNAEGNSFVFNTEHEGMEIKFAEEFTRLQGKFMFCANQQEAIESLIALADHRQWKSLYCQEPFLLKIFNAANLSLVSNISLPDAAAAITGCELLVARTGSIVMSAAQSSGRVVSVFAPIHIVFAYSHQLVFDIKDGLQKLKAKYKHHLPSMITFATGPSRTADIEKTLVVGVHGPKEVYVFLIDEA